MSPKNRTLLLVCLLPLLLTATVLVLRKAPPAPLPALPAPAPSAVILMNLVQPASPAVAVPVMEAIGWSLEHAQIRTGERQSGETVSYLSLAAISAGQYDTLPIFDAQLDVLYAYLPTYNGVMRIPAAVGFRQGERYFSLDGSQLSAAADRDAVLSAARQSLPRGQSFALTVQRASYADGVDRSDCTRDDLPAWCQLAVDFNQDYPDVERLFLSKIVTSQTWLPVGWLFSRYPENTEYDLRVELPAEEK